jgi:hypothetical protein
MKRQLLALSVAALAAAKPAPGQGSVRYDPLADSSAAQILAHAHAGSTLRSDVIVDVMRQIGKAQPRAKLDELADSLVQIALTPAGSEGLGALLSAGALDRADGVPYDGALDHLMRIHRDAHDMRTRQGALDHMLDVPGRDRAIQYLRQVAVSPSDSTAWVAIGKLFEDTAPGRQWPATPEQRQATLTMLHQMWEQDLVKNPAARLILNQNALFNKWSKRG